MASDRGVTAADNVTFKCGACVHTFDAPPTRVEPEPARSHPFRYYAECPYCHDEVEQVHWQVGTFCSLGKHTGPKTAEGKAAVAKNLEGRNSDVTRFNGLKHGAYAKTAVFFPARPGCYPQCDSCDIDFDYCRQQTACLRRTELTMQYLAAVRSGDPTLIGEHQAVNQAVLQAMLTDIMRAIIADGVRLENPVYDFDKDGGFHIGQFKNELTGETHTITEIKAHPLLKPMIDIMSRNGMSLADLNLTPKVLVDQGIELGNLQKEEDNRDQAAVHREAMNKRLDGMRDLIRSSQARRNSDPVLVEYQMSDAEGEKDITPRGE